MVSISLPSKFDERFASVSLHLPPGFPTSFGVLNVVHHHTGSYQACCSQPFVGSFQGRLTAYLFAALLDSLRDQVFTITPAQLFLLLVRVSDGSVGTSNSTDSPYSLSDQVGFLGEAPGDFQGRPSLLFPSIV